MGAFRPAGPGKWVCDNVPPGNTVATAWFESIGIRVEQPLHREAGQDVSLSLHLPKRTATVRLSPSTRPTAIGLADTVRHVLSELRTDGKTEQTLPPGDYSVTQSDQHVTLHAGETVEVKPPPPSTQPTPVRVIVYLWTPTGQSRLSPDVTLIDLNGKAIPAEPALGHEYTAFKVPPGQYTLHMPLPDGQVKEQAVTATKADDGVSAVQANVVF